MRSRGVIRSILNKRPAPAFATPPTDAVASDCGTRRACLRPEPRSPARRLLAPSGCSVATLRRIGAQARRKPLSPLDSNPAGSGMWGAVAPTGVALR
jgi:hypothetical protein